ncbi:MAG: Cation efflux system protein CusB [Bryobacterales bacterium]|nr:Cation efflux system protein CusB [Bryobacterales bacterium]
MKAKWLLITLLVVAVAAASWFALMMRPAPVAKAVAVEKTRDVYYCPMHQTYHSDKPGLCPICSMKLVKLETTPAVAQQQEPGIFVAPEKQQLIGMRSVQAELGELTREIQIVGKVSPDETHLTHIHSKVSGYIEEVFADSIGKAVRAGDPLFTIYSPDLLATQQDFLLALKSRYLLKGSSVASASQGSENLIDAVRERLRLWDVTEQDIRSLETEGKAKRAITVYSPVSGVVMERAAYHHGTFVDSSKDLFTIVDLSQVWIIGEVYETDLPFVRVGQVAEVKLPYSAGSRMRGGIDFIYPFLDPKTGTVQVRMTFANPGQQLKPEMFANITVAVSGGRQVTIPQDAVMDTGTEQYVFIDKGNGYVQPRQVKVSAGSGERVGISQGLEAGERVVTGANFIVDAESRLKGAIAGMGAPATQEKK